MYLYTRPRTTLHELVVFFLLLALLCCVEKKAEKNNETNTLNKKKSSLSLSRGFLASSLSAHIIQPGNALSFIADQTRAAKRKRPPENDGKSVLFLRDRSIRCRVPAMRRTFNDQSDDERREIDGPKIDLRQQQKHSDDDERFLVAFSFFDEEPTDGASVLGRGERAFDFRVVRRIRPGATHL